VPAKETLEHFFNNYLAAAGICGEGLAIGKTDALAEMGGRYRSIRLIPLPPPSYRGEKRSRLGGPGGSNTS
jgi:hypothetical protein